MNKLELHLEKGLILEFLKIKHPSLNEMKTLIEKSVEKREKFIPLITEYINEDTYLYKDYVYKVKYFKEVLTKYNDKLENFFSTLVELEKILIQYDEKLIKLNKDKFSF